jgi:pimeloyl-ACP methyl ester carboxylesterase
MKEWDFQANERALRLRICEWGEGNPTTVILHGYLEQAAAWDAVAQRLAGRVVAPDHRGHGLSEHVGRGGFYHFWDYVSDVDALIATLDQSVILIGHSMGGGGTYSQGSAQGRARP